MVLRLVPNGSRVLKIQERIFIPIAGTASVAGNRSGSSVAGLFDRRTRVANYAIDLSSTLLSPSCRGSTSAKVNTSRKDRGLTNSEPLSERRC